MRKILQNEDPLKSVAASFGPAALAGLLLVLPLALLESLNNDITRQNARGLLVLFGFLWLLPAAFVVVLAPLVRAARAGRNAAARPVNLVLRLAFLAFVVMAWVSLVNDQMPCFLGVPNCD